MQPLVTDLKPKYLKQNRNYFFSLIKIIQISPFDAAITWLFHSLQRPSPYLYSRMPHSDKMVTVVPAIMLIFQQQQRNRGKGKGYTSQLNKCPFKHFLRSSSL